MWQNLNRLFSVPKGFGKFFPKNGTGSTTASAGKKSASGSSKIGGGGGRKPDFNGPGGPTWAMAGTTVAGVALVGYLMTKNSAGK
jgi:hypothetical protein